MRLQKQGPVGRYKESIIKDPIPGNQTCCLPAMVPKADNLPKLQRRDHEKYKDYTSDQGRSLVKSENQMEMDKVHTHSMEQPGTLLVIGRETYVPKERKTINLDHGHPILYYIYLITCQKSARIKEIIPVISKKS